MKNRDSLLAVARDACLLYSIVEFEDILLFSVVMGTTSPESQEGQALGLAPPRVPIFSHKEITYW